MGVQATLREITAAFNSAAAQNANYDDIETAFNDALDRTGEVDNAMGVDLDMGLNRIINLGDSRGEGHAAMNYDEIYALIVALVGSASIPTDGGDVIIVEEFGQFYRQISGANEGQTVFPLNNGYVVGGNNLAVYINGVLQVNELDYTETNDITVTFLVPLTAEDTVQFVWSKTITAVPTNVYLTKTVKIFTNSAGVTTFPINYNPGNVDVFLNGVKLIRQEDFNGDNGVSIILNTPVVANEDYLELTAYSDFSIANHYTKEEVYAKDETYSQLETYNQTETYTKAEVDALLSGGANAVPIGSILVNPSNVVDTGYFECNGAQINRTTYVDLFNKIGTIYGAGNGLTTFNIPDLRGEFLRGFDNGRGVDTSRGIGSFQAGTSTSTLSGNLQTEIVGEYLPTGPFPIPTDGNYSSPVQTANNGGSGADHRLSIALNYASGEPTPRNIAMMYQIKY